MPKTIIITGANGNLGVAAVKKFLDEGYKVIAVSKVGEHLGFAADHDKFELKQVDLADEKATTAFAEELISLEGRIDGALLLAGGFAMGDIGATDGEALKKMISLNFETAYFIAGPLFRHMLENGYGRLVFIGARHALKPEQGKGALAYSLSKSLLFQLAELLNAQAKASNVLAAVVRPSTMGTPNKRKNTPHPNFSQLLPPHRLSPHTQNIFSDTKNASI